MPGSRQTGLAGGLFCTTLATLLLELLDTRLLSVVTWYHLSFFAVSLAMLGMAGGALYVFLGGAAFEGVEAERRVAAYGLRFAFAIPATHLVNLLVPIPPLGEAPVREVAAIAVSIGALCVPFFLSGVVVTLALTRLGGSIGWLYAWDLLGAAAGCALYVPLLQASDVTSLALAAAAAAAAGAACFASGLGTGRLRLALLAVLGLAAAAGLNAAGGFVQPPFAKGEPLSRAAIAQARWNSHSFVIVDQPRPGPVVLWGPGRGLVPQQRAVAWVVIDGEAGTPITAWDGDRAALDWIRHDVTSLAYRLRRGAAAVLGVGGGRDVLAAIEGGSAPIVGVEINGILVELLTRSHRRFAGIADAPGVELIHDEARSYLSRGERRFDVVQMSLVDTWAATGAGAFTLSENGLYTREAWRLFLDALTPSGVLSVSRWFDPTNVSETSRLTALAVAALLDRGVSDPRRHVLLVAGGPVATLVVGREPLRDADRQALEAVLHEEGFELLAAPWADAATSRLAAILASRTAEALDAAVADPVFDYTPPDDARPYFFNMLRPGALLRWRPGTGAGQGVIWGNLRATAMLLLLLALVSALVAAVLVWPLLRSGRAPMRSRPFVLGVAYFAAIGVGFMLVQVALVQRFAVYLGHPSYTLAVVLFTMILAAGLGSLASERLPVPSRRALALPPAVALVILGAWAALEPLMAATLRRGLASRALVVVAVTAAVSVLLGFCFPVGVRLLGRLSPRSVAWMWGVNGACSVLASILALAASMWIGIDANLWAAAALYALLLVPMRGLAAEAGPAGAQP